MSPSSDIEKQENTTPGKSRKAGENAQSTLDVFFSIDCARLCPRDTKSGPPAVLKEVQGALTTRWRYFLNLHFGVRGSHVQCSYERRGRYIGPHWHPLWPGCGIYREDSKSTSASPTRRHSTSGSQLPGHVPPLSPFHEIETHVHPHSHTHSWHILRPHCT